MRAYLHHMTLTSALGRGCEPTLQALRTHRSGLARNAFAGEHYDTWTGIVDKLDGVALPIGMERFDCRSNRLTELALLQDGFADAVLATREKHGANRVGLYVGTSSAGILEVELGYRRRNDHVRALPDGLRYREAMNLFSPAAYVAERFKLERTGDGRLVGLLVEREGVRRCVPCDACGALRRGHRRRRGNALPHDASRLRVAGTAFPRALPSLRCRARRNLAGRSRRLRRCSRASAVTPTWC